MLDDPISIIVTYFSLSHADKKKKLHEVALKKVLLLFFAPLTPEGSLTAFFHVGIFYTV